MSSGSSEKKWHKLEEDLLLPLMAIATVSLIAVLIITAADWLIPNFSVVSGYPVIIVAVVIESVYVNRFARKRGWRFIQRLREVLVLVFIARVTVAVSVGGTAGLLGILRIAGWKEVNFLLHALALFLPWLWGTAFENDIYRLTYDPAPEGIVRGSDEYENWLSNTMQRFQSKRYGYLWLRFFIFAFVAVLIIGTYKHLSIKFPGTEGAYTTLVWLGIGYYVVGLIFLSYVYFLKKRTEWIARGYEGFSNVAGKWLKTSAGIAIIMTALALLLPVNYSPLAGKSTWITKFLDSLFPSSNIGEEAGKVGEAFTSIAEGLGRTADLQGENAPVRRTFFSDIFDFFINNWAAIKNILLIVGVGLLFLFIILPLFKRGRRFSLRAALNWVLKALRASASFPKAIVSYIERLFDWLLLIFFQRKRRMVYGKEGDLGDLLGLLNPQGIKRSIFLKKTLAVLKFYKRMMDLASQRGHPYRKTQTASEYSGYLGLKFPATKKWIDSLTLLLLKARYGGVELDRTETRAAKSSWQEIKKCLEQVES